LRRSRACRRRTEAGQTVRYLLGREETPRLVDLLLHLPASVSIAARGRKSATLFREPW